MSQVKKPTVCLSMIVKNESHIILECLASMAPYIDSYCICDTGSTDGTQDLIRTFFADRGISGEVIQHEWQNFGHNRTLALQACDGKADYAWMIDADDFVSGDFRFPTDMSADGYTLKIERGNFSWWRNQIFRTGIGWHFVGVLHEYAACHKPNPKVGKLEGNYSIQARTLGARNVGCTPIEKYSKDAEMLEKALIDEPNNSRYWFYLAQSYFDSQQWDQATRAYQKRAEIGGWEEEVYYSLFRLGILSVITQKPWLETQQAFLQAWSYRPIRAEPLHELSRLYRASGNPRLAHLFAKMGLTIQAPDHDILFIEPDVYKWKLLDEFASTAYYVHDFMGGHDACVKLLSMSDIPESEKERIRANYQHYLPKVQEVIAYRGMMDQMRKDREKEEREQNRLKKVAQPTTPTRSFKQRKKQKN